MSKFVYNLCDLAKGRITFHSLEIAGVDQLKAFEEHITQTNQPKLTSQYIRLIARLDLFAKGEKLDKTKGKMLFREKEYSAWELKTKNLRLYFIHIPKADYTICIGGYKKNQKKDIARLKKVAMEIVADKIDKLESKPND